MIINIPENDYYKKFRLNPHLFVSKEFLNLNKSKVDQIYRLVEDTSNPSIGIVAGLKDGYLYCPFSAPYGGFHYSHELVYSNVIYEFINNLKYFIINHELKGIKITLSPNIYHETINAKLINCLFNSGFKVLSLDINSSIDLVSFNNTFNEKSSLKHLKQAIKNNLSFKVLTEVNEKLIAYEIIKANRIKFERSIYMSFSDLEDMISICNVDYFGVYNAANEMVAASINYRNHKTIIHGVFWGDNEKGRSLRAMDFCIFNLLVYYKQIGYKFIDIGISTQDGIPNEGLLRFKETHEAISSLRYTFSWSNVQLDSTDTDISLSRNQEVSSAEGNNVTFDYFACNECKKILPLTTIIEKYGIILRLVEISDAKYITKLKYGKELNRIILDTGSESKEQIDWIHKYKIREKAGLEYCFIALDQNGNKYGIIQLYKQNGKYFELGDLLFISPTSPEIVYKVILNLLETGFKVFGSEYCKIEIPKQISEVLMYLKEFEPVQVNEDDLNFYFALSKESFYLQRNEIIISSFVPKEQNEKVKIHPSSDIRTNHVGENTSIWQYCVILENAIIGKNCNINSYVFIENDVIIGDNVTIKCGVQVWDGLRIENNVFVGPNVTFTNDLSPRSKASPKLLPTFISKGASIGANSTLLGGITIGKFAMIGAGSLVTKNVPDYSLWYGNPATFKANICECGNKLDNQLVCSKCNKTYKKTNNQIEEI